MNKILFVLLILLLCGCATKKVYMPISAPCPHINLPVYPIYPQINEDATPSEFVKWCLVSNKMCRDNNQQLRMIYDK